MKRWQLLPLQNKIILLALAIFFVSFFVYTLLMTGETLDRIDDQLKEEAEYGAKTFRRHLEDRLERLALKLRYSRHNRNALQHEGDIRTVFLSSRELSNRDSTNTKNAGAAEKPGISKSLLEAMRYSYRQQSGVTSFISMGPGRLGLLAAEPIYSPDPGLKRQGCRALVQPVSQAMLDRLQNSLKSQILLFQKGHCILSTVFTPDGLAYYTDISIPRDIYLRELQAPENFVELQARLQEFTHTISLNRLFNYRGEAAGTIGVAVPRYSVAGAISNNYEQSALVFLLIFLGVSLLLVILTRPVVRTLKSIAALATEISFGRLRGRIDYHSDDELGDVVHSVNRLAENMQSALEQSNRIKQEEHEHRRETRILLGTLKQELKKLVRYTREIAATIPADHEAALELEKLSRKIGRLLLAFQEGGPRAPEWPLIQESLQGARILCLSGREEFCRSLESTLSSSNCRWLRAEDLESACRIADEESIDVLYIDSNTVSLPPAEWLRLKDEHPALNKIKIIYG